jgi:hypothetical protein
MGGGERTRPLPIGALKNRAGNKTSRVNPVKHGVKSAQIHIMLFLVICPVLHVTMEE